MRTYDFKSLKQFSTVFNELIRTKPIQREAEVERNREREGA